MHLSTFLPLISIAGASPLQLPFLSPSPSSSSSPPPSTSNASLVPLTLGVMSKCPDAEICETLIDRVLDTHTTSTGKQVVGDLVQLELVYLAKYRSNDTKDDDDSSSYGGLVCMHGRSECIANTQQLCAAKYWSKSPTTSESGFEESDLVEELMTMDDADKAEGKWKDWWNFVQCMNYGKRDRIGDLSTAKECAKVVGKEWTKELEECSADREDSEGARLFRKSVERVRKLKIEKSCTIVLNERKICVHDGTWKECPNGHEVGDIAKQIKDEYKRINTDSRSAFFEDIVDVVADDVEDEDEEWVVV